ncbi:hypothetical protein ACTS9D_10160 [Empedobacter brevis]
MKLKSFLGKFENKKIFKQINYWLLIAESGKIIDEKNENFSKRVLVLFDTNLDQFNLINHSPIKNSLWILKTDLEILS